MQRRTEIEAFLSSIGSSGEKRWFKDPDERAARSRLLVCAMVHDEIAGMGGLIVSYGFYPYFWVIVKASHQGKGIGKEVMKAVLRYGGERHSFVVLSVDRENVAAMSLYSSLGYEVYYETARVAWMGIVLRQRGRAALGFLKICQRVYNYMFGSFLRPCLVLIRDFRIGRGMARQEIAFIDVVHPCRDPKVK